MESHQIRTQTSETEDKINYLLADLQAKLPQLCSIRIVPVISDKSTAGHIYERLRIEVVL